MSGRLGDAWRHNPFMLLLGLPAAGWLTITSLWVLATGRPVSSLRPGAWLLWLVAALLIGWGVIRNIPAHEFDWTRPPEPVGAHSH